MSDAGPQAVLTKLRELLEELREVVRQEDARDGLRFLREPRRADGMRPGQLGHSRALDWAQRVYRMRRSRKEFLGPLFAEPAWDILLDLFIAFLEGRKVSVTSACIAADVPSSTGLRWLARLESEGLVQRVEDLVDHRVTWICLTRDAITRMMRVYEHFSRE